MSVAERAAYVIASGTISVDASTWPVAALATVGSASGAAITSTSAILGLLRPDDLSGRLRLFLHNWVRLSFLRCTSSPIACLAAVMW